MPPKLQALFACFALMVVLGLLPALAREDAQVEPVRVRRPIALVLADDGKTLWIGNRESGTISIVDVERRRIREEVSVGRKLSDLTATASRDLALAIDEEAGEIVFLVPAKGTLREIRRFRIGMSPVSVRLSDDGKVAAIACLWPRQIVLVDVDAAKKATTPPRLGATDAVAIGLSFAPRRLLMVPGTSKLIVADAFGGGLAVIDTVRKTVDSTRNLAVHNIRGLALDHKRQQVLLTHQLLNSTAHTQRGEIQNGNLLANNVRKITLAKLLNRAALTADDDRIFSVGDIERGAGDPTEVVETNAGQTVIALAGVNEIAIGRPEDVVWMRLAVGHRPTALVLDADHHRAFVANTFGDSISIIDLQAGQALGEISLGKIGELRAAERGELLFFNARLSHDAWMSCHSCHPDGHTNGRLNDNFSDGSFGTSKRVLTLLGAKDTGPWAWNGQVKDIESQVRTSLKTTMHGPTPSPNTIADLTAYLRTLQPAPSIAQARGENDVPKRERGQALFARLKCVSCHVPPLYTSPRAYDVGLTDEAGTTHFNPPSLRGVSQGGPYFHDNRALTLDEVFTRFRHQLAEPLAPAQLQDLLHFLRSL